MKFKDSIVMQSLEKLAVQKGLIKPEVMKVEASAEPEPQSESFTENLLLLCNKLRAKGFNKYASELEAKFLNLKQAEAKLYDITGEKGEDLVDFAHPKGGVKLDQDWDDLGTVETTTEQHEKILNVVHKPVKGKLEAKSAINAIKIILAQSGKDLIKEKLNKAHELLMSVFNTVNTNPPFVGELDEKMDSRVLTMKFLISDRELRNPDITANSIKHAMSGITEIRSFLMPRSDTPLPKLDTPEEKIRITQERTAKGDYSVPQNVWEKIEPSLNSITSLLHEASSLIGGVSDFSNKADDLIKRLNSYKALLEDPEIDEATRSNGKKWIAQAVAIIAKYKNIFDQLDPQIKQEQTATYEQKLNALNEEVASFYNQFILGQGNQ